MTSSNSAEWTTKIYKKYLVGTCDMMWLICLCMYILIDMNSSAKNNEQEFLLPLDQEEDMTDRYGWTIPNRYTDQEEDMMDRYGWTIPNGHSSRGSDAVSLERHKGATECFTLEKDNMALEFNAGFTRTDIESLTK